MIGGSAFIDCWQPEKKGEAGAATAQVDWSLQVEHSSEKGPYGQSQLGMGMTVRRGDKKL